MTLTQGESIFYGTHAIQTLLIHSPQRVKRILYTGALKGSKAKCITQAEELNIEVLSVRPRQIDHYLPNETHQNIMAFADSTPLIKWKDLCDPNQYPLLVALDQVTDPRNFGAILRSAEALGVHGALITSNRCARPGPVVAKTSVGASEIIPIAMEKNLANALEYAKKQGYTIIGSDMNGSDVVSFQWPTACVLVIGAEGKGMRQKTRSLCDSMISINLKGHTESLNASVAASILFHTMVQSQQSS